MDTILAQVEKPTRYLGGEVGAIVKDPSAVEVRIALAFPDLYEVGMSHFGYQVLYAILNDLPWCGAERVYCPWPDMEDALRRAGRPLFALESKSPLREFDLLGFTLQYELAATGVLQILDLAGIPQRAAQRGEDDPLVIAGGPCAANPEPWALFFDALYIGDGEQGVVELAEFLRRAKAEGLTRAQRLDGLAAIEGMYLPSRWKPLYEANRFVGFDLPAGAPQRVRRRIVTDLDQTPTTRQPMLPNVRSIHDRLAVEVMRGCTRGCRYCQAGYLYRPVRERGAAIVARIVDEGLRATGHDEVTLLSLSTGDWTPIAAALPALMRELAPRRVALSLPSLRAESLTGELAEAIRSVRRTGFTIAPEAATERLRRAINKPIGDEVVLETVAQVFDAGWELVKLYFMIGLPTETPADAAAIVELIKRVFSKAKSRTARAKLNATISVFVPKAHTPFERQGMLSLAAAKERLAGFEHTMFRGQVSLKWHNPEMSLVEGAIAHGDRRVGEAIERAYQDGGRFDGWREFFDLPRWRNAFLQAGLDIEAVATHVYGEDDVLPWSSVDIGVSQPFLKEEYARALRGETTPDCRDGRCQACGLREWKLSAELAEAVAPPVPPRKPSPPAARFRYRLRYAKRGTARWFGHLDLASILTRACRRGGLPVLYSEGFHPQPRISFGPPWSVGIASDEEYLDVLLAHAIKEEDIVAAFVGGLPAGLVVEKATMITRDEPSAFDAVKGWSFAIDLTRLAKGGDYVAAVAGFLARQTSPVAVVKKGKERMSDARELVSDAAVEGTFLRLDMVHARSGGLRPQVLAATVLGLTEDDVPPAAITKRRTDI